MTSEGLSIRPQTLRLSPQYRRLRDTILRPHLRLTESRYFWERWKPLLGPDAAVLIMEVRDRCNRALSGGSPESLPGIQHSGAPSADDASGPADGCTVSANELAAACGFSRVTLWRLLQREDVRRFVRVEHNYVYDRRLGKKRRTVSTYYVQMEDPLVEQDEARLEQLAGATAGTGQTLGTSHQPPAIDHQPPTTSHQVTVGATEAAPAAAAGLDGARAVARLRVPLASPPPTVQFETKVVHNRPPTLHLETADSGSNSKPQDVQETITKERLGTNGQTSRPPEVDLWRKYPELAHHVEEAERLLGDTHSRGFYLKALKRLYPGHLDIWQRALGLAREQQHIRRSRGALFTRLLRTFAAEAGVSL